jgi:CsoR family transcriptional regulator, copper-sensing transcriptional repressor
MYDLLRFGYPTPTGGVGAKLDVLTRLKNVEGHVRGIEKMVEQDSYCIDIIRQIQAVQAALNKISSQVLDNHLNSCVITALRGDNLEERERVLKEIEEVFEAATKV